MSKTWSPPAVVLLSVPMIAEAAGLAWLTQMAGSSATSPDPATGPVSRSQDTIPENGPTCGSSGCVSGCVVPGAGCVSGCVSGCVEPGAVQVTLSVGFTEPSDDVKSNPFHDVF